MASAQWYGGASIDVTPTSTPYEHEKTAFNGQRHNLLLGQPWWLLCLTSGFTEVGCCYYFYYDELWLGFCYYSLLLKLWLSKLNSWLMIKRLTGAMLILSLVPCSSSSSSSGCRLFIIISIIVVLATRWDCCSGWINVFMINITSIASILLYIRGIKYTTRRKVKGLSPLFLKACNCQ